MTLLTARAFGGPSDSMSKKKKTKLYDTVLLPNRPSGSIKGMTERDPQDVACYTWYDLSSAVIDGKGQVIMRSAGQYRSDVDEIIHWCGEITIPPDHPDYAKFLQAVEEAKKPDY